MAAETTSSGTGVVTKSQETSLETSKPSIITTTTSGPSTTMKIITGFEETTTSGVTTGPITSSTTAVVEVTTRPETTTSHESTISTSKPSVETTTTEGLSTTTKSSTSTSFETSTSEAPTVITVTTKAPTEVTTGSKTISTTVVLERTTSVPIITTTGQETAVVTSKPSLSTKTTEGLSSATTKITTSPVTTVNIDTTKEAGEVTTGPITKFTTVAEDTSTSKKPSVVTSKPSVSTTTTSEPSTTSTTTSSTTAVVVTGSSLPELTASSQSSIFVTSKPSVSTQTTQQNPTTTKGTTTTVEETTTSEVTTVKVGSTKPPIVETTGPVTTFTTMAAETTSSGTGVVTKSQETSLETSKPSIITTTTSGPSTTMKIITGFEETTTSGVTTGPITSSTTAVVEVTTRPETTTSHESTISTSKPSVETTTTEGLSTTTKSSTSTSFETSTSEHLTTHIAPLTKTLPGSTTIITASTPSQSNGTTVSSSSSYTVSSPCICTVNKTTYRPGDLLYNVTDGLEWCYTAYCNASCEIETQSSPCPTTPTSSTTPHFTTPVVITMSTSVPLTTTTPSSVSTKPTNPSTASLDCNDVNPPKQNGDSWKVGNCSQATCTNGQISVIPVDCPVVYQPICTNGRQAVQIYDEDGCCFHYECACVCSVWSGSHYMTFDGKTYDFNENCSYYLVREIISTHNLTILKSHDHCDPSDPSFCPLTLKVTYQSFEVVLTQQKASGTVTNVVYVNQKRIYPAYRNPVLQVIGTDMAITVAIQDISTKIEYRGSSFSIDLPHSLFGGNTEGQCGTCDNSQTNDCRSPNGQVASCSDSAGQWLVPGTPCVTPSTPPVITIGPTTTAQPPSSTAEPICKSPLCDLLSSNIFAPCHAVIAPGPFATSCLYDNCNGGNNSCSSLEAYATECSNAGVCIDWRNASNGLCEHDCPSNKVYMACGPLIEPTCNDRYNKIFQASSNYTKEGCFCPPDTTLFNTVHNTCVTSCGCVGPDGKPKQPGDTWTSDCNVCECDGDSMSIKCEPVECPAVQSLNCSEPGQRLVNKVDGCCTKPSCECSVDLCAAPISCPLGFQLAVTNGTCCQSYHCEPKGVCVYDMTEFKPGAKIPIGETSALGLPPATIAFSEINQATSGYSSEESVQSTPCQECYCGPSMDPITKLNIITCKPVVCNTSCPEGFEYQTTVGKCCGRCVQRSCIFTTPDNLTVHIIEVNDTFTPPNDKCVQYTCEMINGQMVTKETKTTCPSFNSLDCVPGTETTDASGCCKTCKLQSVCKVQSEQTFITMNGCTSAEQVNVTSCVGHCQSSSMYSAAANAITHRCECCQEATTSVKQVELICAGGSKLQHSYTQVETCHCSKDSCSGGNN